MNLRLILMRHAEAEKFAFDQKDITRKLTVHGQKEAANSAQFLSDFQIDKLLLSPSKRTMQTASILGEKINIKDTEIAENLYNQNEISPILTLINQQDHENPHLLLVGHNPLIYQLATYLTHEDSDYYAELLEHNMPTAAIIILTFKQIKYWYELDAHQGEIIHYYLPS